MNRNNIFIKILFITSFAMILAIASNHNQTFALTYKKGDILTTRSTSASGLTGHNGIYIGNGKVLDTPRVHHYPRVMSVKKWIKSYPKTKVTRPKNSSLGNKAANNAVKYFKGKKIPYKVTPNPKNIKKTYCSEIVWYSYYKAGKQYMIPEHGVWLPPSIVAPYAFVNKQDVKHNGFKFVDNKW